VEDLNFRRGGRGYILQDNYKYKFIDQMTRNIQADLGGGGG
jgi:hypothetical protein